MKRKTNIKITKTAIAALFTAAIAIISQISVLTPFGVPFTLQVLAVALSGYLLGVKWGVACVGTYILLGAIGLPIFSNFNGSIQVLLGPSGGFIWGFLLLTAACGLANRFKKRFLKILCALAGLLLCHLLGVLQLAAVSDITIFSAFITSSLPYLPKDIILVISTLYFAKYMNQKLKFKY